MSLSVCLLATARVCATKLCLFVLTYKQARTSTALLFCSHLQKGSAVYILSSLRLVMLQRNIMLFIFIIDIIDACANSGYQALTLSEGPG